MSDETMQAVRVHEFGGPDVLRFDEVERPRPAAGEVLVRVAAAALNPPDWYVREGMPDVPPEIVPPIRLPMILGTDASGVVEDLGDGVTELGVGDEVFGMLRFPESLQSATYAQYVTAPVSDLGRKPEGVSHRDAAGASMSALTAWQYLIDLGHDHPSPFQDFRHAPATIDSDTTVLVNGAAGGVGHLGLQLAKWKGARVIAVASGEHESFLADLGADEFVDYTRAAPEEVVRDVDIVLDCVGGAGSERLLPVLKRGGAMYPVYLAEFDPVVVERLGVTVSLTQVRSNGRQIEQIARLVDEGTLRVGIDGAYPLAEAGEAHARAARGHIQGKILLDVA